MRRIPSIVSLLAAIALLLAPTPRAEAKPAQTGLKPKSARLAEPTYHTVYPGQTLGMIAKRYNVSVEALCSANAITRRNSIKPGQKLIVPGTGNQTTLGSRTSPGPMPLLRNDLSTIRPPRALDSSTSLKPGGNLAAAAPSNRAKSPSWKKYVRPARRAGYVVLRATGRKWEGYALVKGNRLAAPGQQGFKRALYSWRTGAEAAIDARLIRLLVKVSDTFGGRPLRVISGFREHSFSRASKHKQGQACDFSVDGVPNEALRDYLLTLPGVGVGYYPNSSFVHLDVRAQNTQWVDHSSPGERPEYEHHDDN